MGNKKCVISSEVTGQIVRNLVRNLVRSDGIKSLTIVQVFVHIVVHVSCTRFVFRICIETDVRCFVYLPFTSSSTRPRFVDFSIFVKIIFVFVVQMIVRVVLFTNIELKRTAIIFICFYGRQPEHGSHYFFRLRRAGS